MTALEMPGISVSFLRKPSITAADVGQQLGAVELEMIGRQREVGCVLLQQDAGSQCASSTLRLPALLACRSAWMKAS